MKQLNDYERGFIEAFVDTDGYISISKNTAKRLSTGWKFRIVLGF